MEWITGLDLPMLIALALVGFGFLIGLARVLPGMLLCILGIIVIIWPGALVTIAMAAVAIGALYVAVVAIKNGGNRTTITNYGDGNYISVVNGQRQEKPKQ